MLEVGKDERTIWAIDATENSAVFTVKLVCNLELLKIILLEVGKDDRTIWATDATENSAVFTVKLVCNLELLKTKFKCFDI